MKMLIQNYSSSLSTEPMYLHRCLVETGFQAELWSNPNISAFDIFDKLQPEIFVSHYKFITSDIVKYMSGKSNMSLCLNVTGINAEDFAKLQDLLKDNNINTPLLFTNLYDTKALPNQSFNTISLYPAADVFLAPAPMPEYNIESCFVSIQENDLAKNLMKDRDSYHVFSFDGNAEYADMNVDITGITGFYNKYDEVVLADDINFVTSQILFDSILKSKKVTIEVSEAQQPMLNEIFSKIFINPESDADISEIIKSQVRTKHNCFKRAARLFRALKLEEASKKMEDVSSRIAPQV